MPDLEQQAIGNNLTLVARHAMTTPMFWLPTMVLYTRAVFGLGAAVTLSGFYYLCVVALEVPSGWASDRFGRVRTLRVAAVSMLAANVVFLAAGDSFALFALGQALVAGGIAGVSGTDVSFHYDTLETLGRAGEYQARQSHVASLQYRAAAAMVLAGGALGLVDLRLPFVAAALAALAQLAIAGAMTEPPAAAGSDPAPDLIGQVGACLAHLNRPVLGWVFFYGTAMVVLEHVAFNLLQPWLTEAIGASADAVGSTPLLSGVVLAVVSAIGSVAARSADPLARRFGVPMALIGLGVVSAVIVSAMAASSSLLVLALIALRSVQGAAAPVLISAAVAPRIPPNQRATFLSLNSLTGRLTWGAILLVVGGMIDEDLGLGLSLLALVAWGFVLATVATLGLAARRIRLDDPGFLAR